MDILLAGGLIISAFPLCNEGNGTGCDRKIHLGSSESHHVAVSQNLETLIHIVLHVICTNPGVSELMDLLVMPDSAVAC